MWGATSAEVVCGSCQAPCAWWQQLREQLPARMPNVQPHSVASALCRHSASSTSRDLSPPRDSTRDKAREGRAALLPRAPSAEQGASKARVRRSRAIYTNSGGGFMTKATISVALLLTIFVIGGCATFTDECSWNRKSPFSSERLITTDQPKAEWERATGRKWPASRPGNSC